jgi:hypothetical protein
MAKYDPNDLPYPSLPKASSTTMPLFAPSGGLYKAPTAADIEQRKAAALKLPINLLGLPRYQGYGPDRPGDESQAASYPAPVPVTPTLGPLMSPEPTPPAMLPFNPRGAGTGAPAGPALGSAENPYSAGPDWGYRNKIAAGGRPGETAVVDYGAGFDSGSGGTTRVQATADQHGRFNSFSDARAPDVFKGGGYAVGPGGYPLNPGDVVPGTAPTGVIAGGGGQFGGGGNTDPYGIRANIAATQMRMALANLKSGGSILDAIHATRYQKDLNNLQERGIQAGQLGVAQGHLGVAQQQLGINRGELGVHLGQLGVSQGTLGVHQGQLGLEREKWANDPVAEGQRMVLGQARYGDPRATRELAQSIAGKDEQILHLPTLTGAWAGRPRDIAEGGVYIQTPTGPQANPPPRLPAPVPTPVPPSLDPLYRSKYRDY